MKNVRTHKYFVSLEVYKKLPKIQAIPVNTYHENNTVTRTHIIFTDYIDRKEK